MNAPRLFLLFSLVVAGISHTVLRLRMLRLGRPVEYATPRGSAVAGVIYALTYAFAPWAKESARRHLPTYLGGIVYHFAIFGVLAMLVASLFIDDYADFSALPLAGLLAAGLVAGLGLFAKRITLAKMRAISIPDDFLANLLVNALLAAGIAAALYPSAMPVFQIAGGVVLLYSPIGKIRHMFFLLPSRRYVGSHFGRRGVKPHVHSSGASHA
jgi:hypothetical protein